jgi:hypothetical protein
MKIVMAFKVDRIKVRNQIKVNTLNISRFDLKFALKLISLNVGLGSVVLSGVFLLTWKAARAANGKPPPDDSSAISKSPPKSWFGNETI